jgi:hypothetical protein
VSLQAEVTPSRPLVLDDEQITQFTELGFLVLPGFLPEDLVSRVIPEVDRWVDDGLRAASIAAAVDPQTHGVPKVLEVDLPAHGELLTHGPLLTALGQLLGPRFVFHHMHSDRHASDLPGKAWHHDYEQRRQAARTYGMIHALHYLDGFGEDMAGLAVLPRSHREVAEKTAYVHHGSDPLPGEVYLESVPRGTTVLAHSALFHARRAKPDQPGRARYFVDASYCETGVLWPPVKPYWRHLLARARALGLDRGEWPELFSDSHFSEYEKA